MQKKSGLSDKDPGARRPVLAVGAVIFKTEQVLLIQRASPPFKGLWSIPGGKVNYGESLIAALHREIREETGISIEVTGIIQPFEALPQDISDAESSPNTDPARNRHYVMIDYVARWVSGMPRPGDDAAAARFFPLSEARDMLAWDDTRKALEMALEMSRHQ